MTTREAAPEGPALWALPRGPFRIPVALLQDLYRYLSCAIRPFDLAVTLHIPHVFTTGEFVELIEVIQVIQVIKLIPTRFGGVIFFRDEGIRFIQIIQIIHVIQVIQVIQIVGVLFWPGIGGMMIHPII